MGRKKKEQLPVNIDKKDLNQAVDDSTKKVVTDIANVESQEDFNNLVALFNLNQSKKNALRVVKLNELLDKVEDQVIDRFDKRPEQMSNQELLEYLKAVENSIDRSQKYVDRIEDKPMIQINQQTNNIKVESEGIQLDRQSKQKVLDLISSLINDIQSPQQEEDLIIDSEEVIEEGETENNDND